MENENIFAAIIKNDFDGVCNLLEAGAKINIKDDKGCFPLEIAAELGNIDIIEALLVSEPHLLLYGYKALWKAAINSHVELSKILIAECGEYICAENILTDAYKKDQIKVAKTLIKAGVEFPYTYLTGELHNAAEKGDIATIQKLVYLEIDVDANQDYDHRRTALMIAASYGGFEIVKLLVNAGANVNAWSRKHTETPLLEAADAGEKEIYDYLYPLVEYDIRKWGKQRLENGFKERQRRKKIEKKRQRIDIECFIHSVIQGDIRGVKNATESQIDINTIASCGRTALMYAARRDDIAIAKLLLSAGADPNIFSDREITDLSRTALMEAVTSRFIMSRESNMIKTLIQSGSNVNLLNEEGQTALILAAMEGYRKAVEVLIENGASLDIQDNYGNSAIVYSYDLNLSEKEDYQGIIESLQNAGAICEGIKNVELMKAVEEGNTNQV